jgi:hypothetical protein
MLKKSSNIKDKIESAKDFFQIKGAECPVYLIKIIEAASHQT